MRSRISRSHPGTTSDSEASPLELKSLSQEFYDCVHTTSQYHPLLIPDELSPIVAPLVEELRTMANGQPLNSSMLQVTHVPFVTISDINKMEDAHYLYNIRDLTLQIRLFNGHAMRRIGSIMTYLGSKLEDQFSPDAGLEDYAPRQDNGTTLVAVRLCQSQPQDRILYNLLQRVHRYFVRLISTDDALGI